MHKETAPGRGAAQGANVRRRPRPHPARRRRRPTTTTTLRVHPPARPAPRRLCRPRRWVARMVLCARRGPYWYAECEVLVRFQRREHGGCGGAEERHAEATAGSYGWQALIRNHAERHGSEESTHCTVIGQFRGTRGEIRRRAGTLDYSDASIVYNKSSWIGGCTYVYYCNQHVYSHQEMSPSKSYTRPIRPPCRHAPRNPMRQPIQTARRQTVLQHPQPCKSNTTHG